MTELQQWVNEGAGVEKGLRLLSQYKPNEWLARLVAGNPERYRHLLVRALGGISPQEAGATISKTPAFRERWPFLSEPDCPQELKILAADKITAYTDFATSHEKLYDCVTVDQCLETAKKCVESFIKNCRIFYEFSYYKENHRILGKHPIFEESKQKEQLRSMDILSLERKRQNIRTSIWKLSAKLRKGDRPDLSADREDLLLSKKRQLEEVENLLNNYTKAYGQRTN